MKIILLITICLFVFSCTNEDKTNYPEGFVLDNDVWISVRDSKGRDLLNPSNENAFYQYNLRVFTVREGKKVEILDENSYKIAKLDTASYYLHLSCGYTTYVEWNKNDTDTLVCTFQKTPNIFSLRSIEYNGKLVQITRLRGPKEISIIK